MCHNEKQKYAMMKVNPQSNFHPRFFMVTAQKMKFFIEDLFSKYDHSKSHVFHGPGFPGSMFFKLQRFLGSGSGSRSRVWVQDLEVAQ